MIFLGEIIKNLKETKSKYIAKPNSNEFVNQVKSYLENLLMKMKMKPNKYKR